MIPSSNLGGASRIVSLWRMKKVRIGLFLFSFFRFPSPIAHLRAILPYKYSSIKTSGMVFSPYRLFCFLLLKQAGISTVQASFMYNETAATRKASIHDFFLANTMHDFLYSICGTKCERFSSVQAYPESCYISCKTKAVGLPPYRLMFIFSQRRRHDYRRAFSLLESVHRITPPVQTILTSQTYPESCCIHEKQSGTVFTHTA